MNSSEPPQQPSPYDSVADYLNFIDGISETVEHLSDQDMADRARRIFGPAELSRPEWGDAQPQLDRAPLTFDDVLRIAMDKWHSPALNMMQITQGYHAMALALARLLGRDANNWYCYATWSSKTITESLSLDGHGLFGTDSSRRTAWTRLRLLVRGAPRSPLGSAYARGVALANRAIFLETVSATIHLMHDGPASYIRVSPESDATPVAPEFLPYLLAEADPRFLGDAATLLSEAVEEDDPVVRAELVLGANIALSAYEQMRMQRVLELRLYRPVRWLTQVWWRSLCSLVTRQPFHRFRLYSTGHEDQPLLTRVLEDLWAAFHTRFFLSLKTPAGKVKVGERLTPSPSTGLTRAWAPIRDKRVRRLAEEFITDDLRGATAGVANWLKYHERMRFIVSYFRLYQNEPTLYDAPFAERIAEELNQRELPEINSADSRRRLDRYPPAMDPDAYEMAHFSLEPFLEMVGL
ncbi:hypothetical protein [Nonomuraea insulae]|uniref:Tryptophan 2,3-dioxygenase n=1 Tax=Nonomuraea insulae TaxID=1616787 RepID=A0ABW1CRU6_9ACTN